MDVIIEDISADELVWSLVRFLTMKMPRLLTVTALIFISFRTSSLVPLLLSLPESSNQNHSAPTSSGENISHLGTSPPVHPNRESPISIGETPVHLPPDVKSPPTMNSDLNSSFPIILRQETPIPELSDNKFIFIDFPPPPMNSDFDSASPMNSKKETLIPKNQDSKSSLSIPPESKSSIPNNPSFISSTSIQPHSQPHLPTKPPGMKSDIIPPAPFKPRPQPAIPTDLQETTTDMVPPDPIQPHPQPQLPMPIPDREFDWHAAPLKPDPQTPITPNQRHTTTGMMPPSLIELNSPINLFPNILPDSPMSIGVMPSPGHDMGFGPSIIGQMPALDNSQIETDGTVPTHPSILNELQMPGAHTTILSELQMSGTHPSILSELQMPGASLVEKIIAVEDRVCGNTCGDDFPSSPPRWNRLVACQACQCDSTCVRYNNCCPDVTLVKNITNKEIDSECTFLSPVDYDYSSTSQKQYYLEQFSSLITNCPNDNGFSKDDEGGKRTLRQKCEEPDVSKPDEAVPVTDASTSLSYSNLHCAECHNASGAHTKRWKTRVSCDNSVKLLKSRPSKMELFQRLSTAEGVQETACHMTYDSPDHNKYLGSCRKPDRQMITRCNDTGMVLFYNADIENACHLYTSLFNNRYKNVFCYMCNTGDTWTMSQLVLRVNDLGIQELTDDPARLQLSSQIDFNIINDGDEDDDEDDDGIADDDDNEEDGGEDDDDEDEDEDNDDDGNDDGQREEEEDEKGDEAVCTPSQIFDSATCSCKDVHCDEWRTFDPESETCTGGLGDMGVGYWTCFRGQIDFQKKPTDETIDSIQRRLQLFKPAYQIYTAFNRFCRQNNPTKINMILHSWAVDEDMDEHGYPFEKTFNADVIRFCDYIYDIQTSSQFLADDYILSCKFERVESKECIEYGNIKDWDLFMCYEVVYNSNITLNGISFNSQRVTSKRSQEKVFFPYKRTDHCPSVVIDASEFNETDSSLVHMASSRSIDKIDVEIIVQNISKSANVRICQKDYIRLITDGSFHCGPDSESKSACDQVSTLNVWMNVCLTSSFTLCLFIL